MSEPVKDVPSEEQELSKEERLEAARRKFEALKKKKKNSNKKKKETKENAKDESEEPESSPAPVDPAVNDEETNKDSEKDDVESTKIIEGQSSSSAEDEEQVKQKGESEESKPIENTNTNGETELKENDSGANVNSKPESQSDGSCVTDLSNDEIAKLKATIETQANTIKSLRDENTDLKLSRMDLQDKISELEKTIEQLKNSKDGYDYTIAKPVNPMKPAESMYKQNDYASESKQNLVTENADFRDNLMSWKGWQVDMTSWGGVNTQIVRL